jgi:hypothetical protein
VCQAALLSSLPVPQRIPFGPSNCALFAPPLKSAVHKYCALGHRIAERLNPIEVRQCRHDHHRYHQYHHHQQQQQQQQQQPPPPQPHRGEGAV